MYAESKNKKMYFSSRMSGLTNNPEFDLKVDLKKIFSHETILQDGNLLNLGGESKKSFILVSKNISKKIKNEKNGIRSKIRSAKTRFDGLKRIFFDTLVSRIDARALLLHVLDRLIISKISVFWRLNHA